MNIGTPNFPTLSAEDIYPYQKAYAAQQAINQNKVMDPMRQQSMAENIQKAMLANQYQRAIQQQQIAAENAKNRQFLQEEPSQTQADITGFQNTIQQGPSKLASDIATNNATSQTILRQKLADAANKEALTAKTKEETRLSPLEQLIKIQQQQQQSSRFGAAYEQARALSSMPAAGRAEWIANHQAEYNQMLSDLGNKTNTQSIITPEILKQYFPGISLNQNNPQTSSQPVPKFHQDTPEEIADTQRVNRMAANKLLTTAATSRQIEGAIQVATLMNSPVVQGQVVNGAQYAGALGKGKAALAAFSQNNPEAFEDYLSLKNDTMPLLLNRIKTLDAMGATNAQRKTLDNMYSKTMDALTSNPKQFITQYNKFGKVLDEVGRSVQASASPVSDIDRIPSFKPISESGQLSDAYIGQNGVDVSKQDVIDFAKSNNTTTDNIIHMYGLKPK